MFSVWFRQRSFETKTRRRKPITTTTVPAACYCFVIRKTKFLFYKIIINRTCFAVETGSGARSTLKSTRFAERAIDGSERRTERTGLARDAE